MINAKKMAMRIKPSIKLRIRLDAPFPQKARKKGGEQEKKARWE